MSRIFSKHLVIAIMAFSQILGAKALAGAMMPIQLHDSVCLSIHLLSIDEILDETSQPMRVSLRSRCEDAPGAQGALMRIQSFDIHNIEGDCATGKLVEYDVKGVCYLP